MSRKNIYILSLLAAGAILSACSQAESGSASTENARTIYGASQKGPFIKGAEVTLYGMDESLHQTGTHFSTEIENNQGEYTLKNMELDDRYAWLNANGFYIDEITGDTSAQKISLNSLVDLQNRDHVNINILTHLSFDRIRRLVKEGKSVDEAKREAEKEVLNAFGFSDDGESFDQLDISGAGKGDAKLLAISLIMLTAEDMGVVTSRMATIALDLETDGVLDDTVLVNQMKKDVSMAGHDGVYNRVRENLINVGATDVSDFQTYVDLFAAPWDSSWGLAYRCGNQDEVRDGHICRGGVWKTYIGPRVEGDAPVDSTGKSGTLVDKRDGKAYKTLDVKLNDGTTATWMVSNLALKPKVESVGGHEWFADPEKGGVYHVCQALDALDEETCESEAYRSGIMDKVLRKENVQGICPEGWHLPQSHERETLDESVKDDYQTRELLAYLRYSETDNLYGIGQIGNDFTLDEDGEFFGQGDNSGIKVIVPYEIRCVKD